MIIGNCSQCPFLHYTPKGLLVCAIKDVNLTIGKVCGFPKNCPLKEKEIVIKMKYKFPKDEMREVIDLDKNEEYGKYKLIEEGDWDDEGKYQYKEIVFTHVNHPGKFFSIVIERSGSYFSEYEYNYNYWGDEVEVTEVKKVEVVKYEWRDVNDII